jgi:antitoxin VapB
MTYPHGARSARRVCDVVRPRDTPQPLGFTELLPPLVIKRVLACASGICLEVLMSEQRHVRLFRNGRNQAIRIPVEFELPGDEAIMPRDGERRVTEPVRKRGLIALLKTMKPLDEEFPEIDDPVPAPERVL